MEAELGEHEHTTPTPQAIFCSIVQQISSAQDECSLHFALAKEDALIVVESLYGDAGVERLANT